MREMLSWLGPRELSLCLPGIKYEEQEWLSYRNFGPWATVIFSLTPEGIKYSYDDGSGEQVEFLPLSFSTPAMLGIHRDLRRITIKYADTSEHRIDWSGHFLTDWRVYESATYQDPAHYLIPSYSKMFDQYLYGQLGVWDRLLAQIEKLRRKLFPS